VQAIVIGPLLFPLDEILRGHALAPRSGWKPSNKNIAQSSTVTIPEDGNAPGLITTYPPKNAHSLPELMAYQLVMSAYLENFIHMNAGGFGIV
jgi:hypothetical protein